jgi:hypothetical protein
MPLKKSTRAKTPPSSKTSENPAGVARLNTSTDTTRMMGAGAVLLVFCVMAAAMLLAARESSSPSTVAVTDSSPGGIVARADSNKSGSAAPSMAGLSAKPAAETAKSPVRKLSSVTIAGCLERGDDSFRLTDTDGSDAPKSRSWKSGFLKKGTASIEVVDTANKLKLSSHVGRRVSVTGLLDDRELQVRSLRRIAPACD